MDLESLCKGCFSEKVGSAECPHCHFQENSPQEASIYLAPGTILENKYIIGNVLGQGGFGITYLGWDKYLNIKLAIKEFFPQGMVSRIPGQSKVVSYKGTEVDQYEFGLDKFLKEAKTLAQFENHPNIVSVRHFFKANGTAYMIMSYVEGMTFDKYLKEQGGKIDFNKTLEIMMPVMDALKEVHAVGFMHRDISPDNILIDEMGGVNIIDFGASRQEIGEKSRSLSVILKAGYAPEEQYRSRGKQGAWTDVYAVSATIYRAITGETPPEAMDRLDEDTLVAPSLKGIKISKNQEEALLKGLSLKAQNRSQTISELQEALNYEEKEAVIDKPKETPLTSSEEMPEEKLSSKEFILRQDEKELPGKIEKPEIPPSMLQGKYYDEKITVKDGQKKKVLLASAAIVCLVLIVLVAFSQLDITGQMTDTSQSEDLEALTMGWQADVSAGVFHSLALTIEGYVYSFGTGEFLDGDNLACGHLGHGDKDDCLVPSRIEQLPVIKSISAGAHSLALSAEGDVYSFGYGGYGQLGHGDTENRLTPTKIEGLSDVKAVSCGVNHSLVLLSNGEVYSFGRNDKGQLGHGDTMNLERPKKIETLSQVKAISAGTDHSLVLLENGSVYSFGNNEQGQLGHGDTEQYLLPVRIATLSNGKAISAGRGGVYGSHSLVLLENGDVYSFGSGIYGQLGHMDLGIRLIPMKIENLPTIKAISAGQYTSFVLTEEGEVYSFGLGGWTMDDESDLSISGVLGIGDYENRFVPTKIEGVMGVESISAGTAHSLILLGNGDVYSFGSGMFYALGHGDGEDRLTPSLVDFQTAELSAVSLRDQSGRLVNISDIDTTSLIAEGSGEELLPALIENDEVSAANNTNVEKESSEITSSPGHSDLYFQWGYRDGNSWADRYHDKEYLANTKFKGSSTERFKAEERRGVNAGGENFSAHALSSYRKGWDQGVLDAIDSFEDVADTGKKASPEKVKEEENDWWDIANDKKTKSDQKKNEKEWWDIAD